MSRPSGQSPMITSRTAPLVKTASLLPTATPLLEGAAAGRPVWAWIIAGLLVLYALYLLLRLFILDRINRETPHQEDPRERDRERI